MEPYAKIDTLVIWEWIDSVRVMSDIRVQEGEKSESVALVEYGFRTALDTLVTRLKELDEDYQREQEEAKARKLSQRKGKGKRRNG